MVYTGSGIELILDFLGAGSTTRPTHMMFGEDAADIVSTLTTSDMDGDFIRKAVTYSKEENTLLYDVKAPFLGTLESGMYSL